LRVGNAKVCVNGLTEEKEKEEVSEEDEENGEEESQDEGVLINQSVNGLIESSHSNFILHADQKTNKRRQH
tara:strand:- start:270 stop:482 length:213 start_codon:yes stop_codon:yes gene_type:complete